MSKQLVLMLADTSGLFGDGNSHGAISELISLGIAVSMVQSSTLDLVHIPVEVGGKRNDSSLPLTRYSTLMNG